MRGTGEYQARRIALDNAIRQIEAQAGLGYDLDRILGQLPSLAGLIRMGSPALQRQALAPIFARLEVANGDIKRAVPTEVWRPFFEDVQDSLRHIVPPRDLEAALRRIVIVPSPPRRGKSWSSQSKACFSGQNRSDTAPRPPGFVTALPVQDGFLA